MWHPARSIYSNERLYRYAQERVSGFSRRPLRPYRRQPASAPGALSQERFIVPANAAPLALEGKSHTPNLALPLYVDSSMLTTWRSCRRKHFWSTLNALYPSGRSVHLIAGGAIAAGCEAARRWVFAQPDPLACGHNETLEAAYPAFTHAWGDYVPPDNPRNAKTFVNTWEALANYLEEYPPARDPVQPLRRADASPATEYRFSIPLPILHPSGDPMLFVGRFDLVGMYQITGMPPIPVVLDEKTTSAFTMGWADSWDLRGQFMGYIWALRQQGMNISHAVVRGIAIQKTQFDTRSALVQYPNHMIARWEHQMLTDVQAIVDSLQVLTGTGTTTGSQRVSR